MNYTTKIKLELIAPIFRFLPRFRGKYRLARFILGKSLETKNINLTTYDDCQYIIPSLQEPVGFALLINGIYEPDSIQFMLNSPNAPIILFEFCDWAEARKPEGNIGDSQRVLINFGYKIWRLSDFVKGGKPLDSILKDGSDMLVGVKHGS